MVEIAGVMRTDSGMFGLWSPAAFGHVSDYDSWEAELADDEDIARHLAAGAFVPVNIGFDGDFKIAVRVGSSADPAELTDRERGYLLMTSDPYVFLSAGVAVVSGIEYVHTLADIGLQVPLPMGRWCVRVALIQSDKEPGQRDEQGQPLPSALPAFTLLINPEQDPNSTYRTSVATFEQRAL